MGEVLEQGVSGAAPLLRAAVYSAAALRHYPLECCSQEEVGVRVAWWADLCHRYLRYRSCRTLLLSKTSGGQLRERERVGQSVSRSVSHSSNNS